MYLLPCILFLVSSLLVNAVSPPFHSFLEMEVGLGLPDGGFCSGRRDREKEIPR